MSNFFNRLLNDSSSSDEEERNMWFAAALEFERQNNQCTGYGDRVSRQYRYRDRVSGNSRLLNDYFVENPVYDETLFRRRFRLSRPLFLRILRTLQQHNNYFVQRRNAANTLGLSGEQKMTAALRMLAYGMSADSIDEYVRIGESTTIECVKRFCQGVVDIFGPEYLRSPNATGIIRLLRKANQRGFPGMLGSLDCMHWEWKNCPAAYHGMYNGHVHRPTIVLEAVASYDLWIWHAFFSMPGSNNDINVLDASNLFANLYLLTRIKIRIAMQRLALQGRDPREEKQLKKANKKVRGVQQILVILFQIRFVNYLSRVKRGRIFLRSKNFNY